MQGHRITDPDVRAAYESVLAWQGLLGNAAVFAEACHNDTATDRVRAAFWPVRVAAHALEDMTVPEFMDELAAARAV